MSDLGLLIAFMVSGVAIAKYLWNIVLFVSTDDIYEYDYTGEARFLFTDTALLIASVIGVLAALAYPIPVSQSENISGSALTITYLVRTTIAAYTSVKNTTIVYEPIMAMVTPLVTPAAILVGLDILLFLLQVLLYYLRRVIGW